MGEFPVQVGNLEFVKGFVDGLDADVFLVLVLVLLLTLGRHCGTVEWNTKFGAIKKIYTSSYVKINTIVTLLSSISKLRIVKYSFALV